MMPRYFAVHIMCHFADPRLAIICIDELLHPRCITSFLGTISNIPAGMVGDQFGMVGLLTFIRAAETDPNLVALAPGIDLTTLGLNLNSPE